MRVCQSTHKQSPPTPFLPSTYQANAFQQRQNLTSTTDLLNPCPGYPAVNMLYSKMGVCKLRWGMPCRPHKRSLLKSFRYLIFPLCIALSSVSVVYALPQGATVESGSATVTQKNATTLDITAANNTIINFSSFNIAQNETVDITMPSNTSKLLARDTGVIKARSWVHWSLTGTLYLQTLTELTLARRQMSRSIISLPPALDISSNDFINSNYVFTHRRGAAYGQISNQGLLLPIILYYREAQSIIQGSSRPCWAVYISYQGTRQL